MTGLRGVAAHAGIGAVEQGLAGADSTAVQKAGQSYLNPNRDTSSDTSDYLEAGAGNAVLDSQLSTFNSQPT